LPRTSAPILAIAVLTLAGRSWGQAAPGQQASDGGPIVVGTPRESWQGFKFSRWDAALDFRLQYQDDKINDKGQASRHDRELRYRELVDLSGDAFIGHRNLIDLTGSVQLGLEDIDTESTLDGVSGHERDFVNTYDLSALILGTSLLPTTVYARREQSLLDRPFAGTIEETLMEEGGGVTVNSLKFPTTARFFHREQNIKGDFGRIDTNIVQDSASLNTAWVINTRQRLDFGYTFDKIDETQPGFSDSYDRHDGNAVHVWSFGDENRPHELRSSLRFYSQSGLQEQDHVRWDEQLTLRHTERLESRYNVSADELDVQGETQRQARAEASVRYRLFESLSATASAGAQRVESPGGFTSDDVFVSGQVSYTKRVPLGRFDASVGGSFDAQTNSERGSTTRVLNETYTFTDPFPIILARRNIVASSVIITPVAGFPVFREGIDYTLRVFPDHAEVRAIVGGGFVSGQQVRISYDLGPEPGSDIDTATGAFSLRYTITEGWLRGAAAYGTFRTTQYTVSAEDPSQFRLDNTNDLLLGLEYRLSDLTLRYEYNLHDSTFDPYDLHRLQVEYVHPLGPGSSVSLNGTHETINYSERGEDVAFDRATLKYLSKLDRYFDLTVQLELRREDSSESGTSQALEETIRLSYKRAQTTIYASFRNSTLDGPESNQTSQFLEFGFRRTF